MQNLIATRTQSPLLSSVPGLLHGFTSKEDAEPIDASVARAKQVHKTDLIWVTHIEKREREADALATFTPGLAIGVSSADCVPILAVALDASTNKVYSSLAIHAGWRGTTLGITEKGFQAFAKESKARFPSKNIRFLAAIGPCISFESFEVHEDVFQQFPQALDRGLARFLRTAEDGRAKYLVDLPGENLRQLREAAMDPSIDLTVDPLGLCTVKLADRFPSYRRDGAAAGRILSFLRF
jgi:YfiH family protein